jgi:hypothetical protein
VDIAENSEVAVDWTAEPKVSFSKRPRGGGVWEPIHTCDTKLSTQDFARLLPVVWLFGEVEIVDE